MLPGSKKLTLVHQCINQNKNKKLPTDRWVEFLIHNTCLWIRFQMLVRLKNLTFKEAHLQSNGGAKPKQMWKFYTTACRVVTSLYVYVKRIVSSSFLLTWYLFLPFLSNLSRNFMSFIVIGSFLHIIPSWYLIITYSYYSNAEWRQVGVVHIIPSFYLIIHYSWYSKVE